MANSSDWIAALGGGGGNGSGRAPAWVDVLAARGDFSAEIPFGAAPRNAGMRGKDADESERAEAIARAFAEGEAAGRAAAAEEAAREGETQRALRIAFRALDQSAMDALADELAETVIALCAATIDEWSEPAQSLENRCREAARRLGSAASACALHLHPEDAARLRDALEGWRIEADPALERGAIVLEGPDGAVRDGPAEWRRAIAAAVRE